jgi:hypothetical protein
MKRRVVLSPTQSGAYTMGRTLLVFDAWERQIGTPIDIDRAMVIDFAVQHPRSLGDLAPVASIAAAHGLGQSDLADLFAQRHLGTMRERFTFAVTQLVARRLVEEVRTSGSVTQFRITDLGREAAGAFSSSLAIAIDAICSRLCEAWQRRRVDDILRDLRQTLPDESRTLAHLAEPFGIWLDEER